MIRTSHVRVYKANVCLTALEATQCSNLSRDGCVHMQTKKHGPQTNLPFYRGRVFQAWYALSSHIYTPNAHTHAHTIHVQIAHTANSIRITHTPAHTQTIRTRTHAHNTHTYTAHNTHTYTHVHTIHIGIAALAATTICNSCTHTNCSTIRIKW